MSDAELIRDLMTRVEFLESRLSKLERRVAGMEMEASEPFPLPPQPVVMPSAWTVPSPRPATTQPMAIDPHSPFGPSVTTKEPSAWAGDPPPYPVTNEVRMPEDFRVEFHESCPDAPGLAVANG